jgi:hypothetical protein
MTYTITIGDNPFGVKLIMLFVFFILFTFIVYKTEISNYIKTKIFIDLFLFIIFYTSIIIVLTRTGILPEKYFNAFYMTTNIILFTLWYYLSTYMTNFVYNYN